MASRFLRMQPLAGMGCCGVSLVRHGEQLKRKGFWRSNSERRPKVVRKVVVRTKNKRAPAFVPCESVAFGDCRTSHVTMFDFGAVAFALVEGKTSLVSPRNEGQIISSIRGRYLKPHITGQDFLPDLP